MNIHIEIPELILDGVPFSERDLPIFEAVFRQKMISLLPAKPDFWKAATPDPRQPQQLTMNPRETTSQLAGIVAQSIVTNGKATNTHPARRP